MGAPLGAPAQDSPGHMVRLPVIFHGVYPGGRTGEEDDIVPADLASYEQTVGKTAAWVYFSNNWYRSRAFPLETATWIRTAGSVPYIRLMLRDSPDEDKANRVFTLSRILSGEFDEDFRAWARAARDFGTPLIAEYGTEMNGEWFPWNGVWNGGARTDRYGDPTFPDGPERFRDAYRRIITLMRGQGASNIIWVFHANNDDWPQESWNRFENYYPGDDVIDWLGVSVYGAQTPMDDYWEEFSPLMDAAYPRLAALAPDKPLIVAELGVTLHNRLGSQSDWARSALTDIIGLRWPRVMGFSWWNEHWQNDDNPRHDTTMRVQDNPALAKVFQELVGADPNVLGRLDFPHSGRIIGPRTEKSEASGPAAAVIRRLPPP